MSAQNKVPCPATSTTRDKCIFLQADEIGSIQEFDAMLGSHDWVIRRKENYSKTGFQVLLECKTCKLERSVAMASTYISKQSQH